MNGRERAYRGAVEGSGGSPLRRAGHTERLRGSIEELTSGSLRVRVYVGVDVLSGREIYLKQLISAGPSARKQAERARDELVQQVLEGRGPRTNASVRQLVERHLEVSEIEPRTRRTLQGYLAKHVVPLVGERPISSVNAEVLDWLYAELRRCRDHCVRQPVLHRSAGEHVCDARCRRHVCRPLAAWTIRKIHYLISSAYESAIRWDWITVNPTVRARKPAPPTPDPQPPTAEEAAALVAECWRWDLGPFVWLAMTTGARRGELCALRWRDLQAHHSEPGEHDCAAAGCRWWLVIRRAIGQDGDRLWETDTKTHQRRHIALDPQTVAVLAEHRRRCEHDAAQLSSAVVGEHFIFAAAPDGATPCKPSSMSQRYARCAKRLGISTTLKNLRHYSATELITAGVDVRTVAGRLGHSGGGTTTLKVYAAWVAAADQHASTVLMNRMPAQPLPRPIEVAPPAVGSRLSHERVATLVHERWRAGTLAPGTQLSVKGLAQDHGISVGTAHRVLALLDQLGVVKVRTGRPTTVTTPGAAHLTPVPAPVAVTEPPNTPSPAVSPRAETAAENNGGQRRTVTLDLLHLGTHVRTMQAKADPDDVDTLQQLLLDAVRRAGGDRDRVGDYELVVRLAGQDQPLTTVVAAA